MPVCHEHKMHVDKAPPCAPGGVCWICHMEAANEPIGRLREACKAMVAWFDAENKHLGTFRDRMDLCKYTEWTARRALGQDVWEFAGVPRLLLQIANEMP